MLASVIASSTAFNAAAFFVSFAASSTVIFVVPTRKLPSVSLSLVDVAVIVISVLSLGCGFSFDKSNKPFVIVYSFLSVSTAFHSTSVVSVSVKPSPPVNVALNCSFSPCKIVVSLLAVVIFIPVATGSPGSGSVVPLSAISAFTVNLISVALTDTSPSIALDNLVKSAFLIAVSKAYPVSAVNVIVAVCAFVIGVSGVLGVSALPPLPSPVVPSPVVPSPVSPACAAGVLSVLAIHFDPDCFTPSGNPVTLAS